MKKKKIKKWLKRWPKIRMEIAAQKAVDSWKHAAEAVAELGAALPVTTLGLMRELVLRQEAERIAALVASGELTAEAGLEKLEMLGTVLPLMDHGQLSRWIAEGVTWEK